MFEEKKKENELVERFVDAVNIQLYFYDDKCIFFEGNLFLQKERQIAK